MSPTIGNSALAPYARFVQRDHDPTHPLGPDFLRGIGDAVGDFLDQQEPVVEGVGAAPMLTLARTFTAGGKRVRPAFCYWSSVAVGGFPTDPAPLLRAAASLDLLHVSALVHDDLIDASETRRGVPAAHRQFQSLHVSRKGRGEAEKYGEASAILLGDLLVMWSLELFDTCGLPADALARARPHLAAVRTEVTCGQFLDISSSFGVTEARDPKAELDVALRILEYKTARYTVRRPAQIGAALAGANPAVDAAFAEFGSLVGRAFQLRDDVLGVFGDPIVTGKPAGDDVSQGKRTVLVLEALQRGTPAQCDALARLLGRPALTTEEVELACQIIDETGAIRIVEDQIARHTERALSILHNTELTDAGRTALVRLTELSVTRDR